MDRNKYAHLMDVNKTQRKIDRLVWQNHFLTIAMMSFAGYLFIFNNNNWKWVLAGFACMIIAVVIGPSDHYVAFQEKEKNK